MNWGKAATAVIAWLLGAMSATAVGMFALTSIDFGSSPDPASDVFPQLPSPSLSLNDQTPAAQPSLAPSGVERQVSSPGGSAVARCSAAGAFLVSWSPAPGYKAEDVRRGPASVARVKFETSGREYYLTVRCVKGVPEATVGH